MSAVTDYVADMANDVNDQEGRWTDEEARDWANRYWEILQDQSLSEDARIGKLKEHSGESRLRRNVDTNVSDNTVVRRHLSADRYYFDFDADFVKDGWLQFDTGQDAWYYGVWVNPKHLWTLSYCEGDVCLVICSDVGHYNAEIREMCAFHREGFELIAMNSVDDLQALLLGGEPSGEPVSILRQNRAQFLISEVMSQ